MANIYDKIRSSRIFQSLMRVLQFLSSIISLGMFSSRLYKVYRLEHRASTSTGAVEGILVAAVVYTIAATFIQCILRNSKNAPAFLRWLLIALDLAFVGAFIAVADLTRPNGGPSGDNSSQFCLTKSMRNEPANKNNTLCKLPLGTFVLAIFSTILHFITAVFHEIRDKQRANKELANKEGQNGGGYNGNGAYAANKEAQNGGNYNGNGTYA